MAVEAAPLRMRSSDLTFVRSSSRRTASTMRDDVLATRASRAHQGVGGSDTEPAAPGLPWYVCGAGPPAPALAWMGPPCGA